MNKQLLTSALAATIALSTIAPALADGAASTRNILITGAAAAIGITNYNHKKREKQAEIQEQHRRQSSYKEWYFNKYGYYPTDEQSREWYKSRYGIYPS